MQIYKELLSAFTTSCACPICGSVNTDSHWKESIETIDDGAVVTSSYYYCKKCGYFARASYSDNPDLWASELGHGISPMKNPFRAIRQCFVLRKHRKKAEHHTFLDHTKYAPKIDFPKTKVHFDIRDILCDVEEE